MSNQKDNPFCNIAISFHPYLVIYSLNFILFSNSCKIVFISMRIYKSLLPFKSNCKFHARICIYWPVSDSQPKDVCKFTGRVWNTPIIAQSLTFLLNGSRKLPFLLILWLLQKWAFSLIHSDCLSVHWSFRILLLLRGSICLCWHTHTHTHKHTHRSNHWPGKLSQCTAHHC